MVVGLLRADSGSRVRFYSIRDVAETGLITVGAALLPALIHGFGPSADLTWRFASLAFSLTWLTSLFFGVRRFSRSGFLRDVPKFLWFGPSASPIANLMLWWNVIHPDALAGARYAVALVVLLAFAGISFIAATFHGRGGQPASEDDEWRNPTSTS